MRTGAPYPVRPHLLLLLAEGPWHTRLGSTRWDP